MPSTADLLLSVLRGRDIMALVVAVILLFTCGLQFALLIPLGVWLGEQLDDYI